MITAICPKCGADILYSILCNYPPLPHAKCSNLNCNWSGADEEETPVRLQFKKEEA